MLSFVRGGTAHSLRDALNWRTIRGRMTVILAVPTCLLLVLVGTAVTNQLQAYRDAHDTRSRIEVALRVQALVHRLQVERTYTNGLVAGDKGYRPQVTGNRERVDASRLSFGSSRLWRGR